MKFVTDIFAKAGLIVDGSVTLNTTPNANIDTDKFLVQDGAIVKYRTGAEVLSDIGAQGALTLTVIGNSGPSTLISNTLNVPTYTLAGLGGVPLTRTLTINGVGYDLSADRSWSVGTVTSVDMSVPTGFAISGNPITSSGTLALAFAAGYALPTVSSQLNWNSAYNNMVTAISYNTSTGDLTLTQQDLGTLSTTITLQPFTTTNLVEGTNLYYTDARVRSAVSLTTIGTTGASTYTALTGVFNIPVYQGQLTLTTTGSSGSSTLVGDTLNIPTYTLSGLGGVPSTRQLTINGTAYDLSADRSWSVGTVTSVAATAGTGISVSGSPITSSGSITITNTAPDQTVVLNNGTGISITGTYPNFTITNTSPAPANTVTGTGTADYLARWTSSSTIGTGTVRDDGTYVGIGTAPTSSFKVDVSGNIRLSTGEYITGYTTSSLTGYSLTPTNFNIGSVYANALTTFDGSSALSINGYRSQFQYTLTGVGASALSLQPFLAYPVVNLTGANARIDATGFTAYIWRTDPSDISTNGSNRLRGFYTIVGNRGGNGITGTPYTNTVVGYEGSIENGGGTVNNMFGVRTYSWQGEFAANSTTNNFYGVYQGMTVGAASGGTHVVTNFYAFYQDTPTVLATGSITNRWGLYFTDSSMPSYHNGNFLIGTNTDAGYKLDVNGTGRFTSNLTANSFIKNGGTSTQFLKADGSVDSNAYITGITSGMVTTALGYTPVPTTRTLTINGTAYDLSADRSWTITSGVSSVSGSGAGISVSPTTGAVVISNTGVTSNVAGTGISVSSATGAVTITNTGVTSVAAGTGISVSASTGGVTITNTGVTSVNGSTGAITGIITTSNYNSYSPTLTGGGASGTWGINITGTAGSETFATVTGRGASTSTALTINNTLTVTAAAGSVHKAIELTPTGGDTTALKASFARFGTIDGTFYTDVLLNSWWDGAVWNADNSSYVGMLFRSHGTTDLGSTAWRWYSAPPAASHSYTERMTLTGSGSLSVTGDMRAPIFYDSANTNYYLDPASTSNLNKIITTGLYGPGGTGNIPIWQYDASNTGYGIVYVEGTPTDALRIDVSGQALTGTPDFYIGPDLAQVNGNTVLHAGNYTSYAPSLTGSGASGTWGINVTGSAGYTQLLDDVNNYSWSMSTLPTSYSLGMQLSFVGPSAGEGSWLDYGTVINARTYAGGGGSLQIYVPYGPSNGGTALKVRFGDYSAPTYGNQWTAWKTLLQSDNYNSYAPTLTGGGASGTWSINITGNAGYASSAGNADTLDGYHGSNYLGKNGNSYYQADTWIQFNTPNGLYWPSYNGAHLYANDGSYGSIKILGSRNGWYGIEFGNAVNLMANTNDVGFHNNNYGWQMRWANGTIYCHKNSYGGGTSATVLDSSNYTSYAPSTTGGGASGTWGISITGSAGSVDFNNLTNKTGGTGTYQTSGDFRAPIFYDSNDTTYYADFANTGTSIYTAGLIRSSGMIMKGSSGGGQIYPTMSNGGVSLYGGSTFTNGAYFTVTGIDYGASPGAGSAEFVIRSTATSKFAMFSYDGSTYTGRYSLWGASGNVTIGSATTDYGVRLAVVGDFYASSTAVIGTSTGYSGYTLKVGVDSTTNGSIYAAGDISAAGSITAASDVKLKTNIREIENPLDRVLKSRGVVYDRIDGTDTNAIGFIAQELEEQFPELVSSDHQGTKGVKYQNMVAVLLEAVKEQQKQINKLQSLINK